MERRFPGLAVALAGAGLLVAPLARGQVCEGGRPTDPGGSQGLAYGSAEAALFDSESGRARIHYALSGPHAPPATATLQGDVPDAVVAAAEAADQALSKYEELGYLAPLGDGDSPCGSNGDSDAVDVYIVNFASADGQAVYDHCEAGSPKRCAGFVLVENDYRGGAYADVAEGMRTVVPHELFHLVQNAYDADVERWWAEGSAQWAAKQVYPELQDLERFLPAFFESPWRPLDQPPAGVVSSFLYATAIWPVFLHERHDAELVREVFEGFSGDGASVFETTDAVLQARASSLAAEHLRFAAYNAATGERAPSAGGYAAGADYPAVELTPFLAEPGASVPDVAAGLGAFYYAAHSDTALVLTLDGDPERVAAVLVPLVDGRAQLGDAAPLPAALEGDGVVIVAGQSLARTDAPFTLTASASQPPKTEGGPEESGCSLARGRPAAPANSGALLGFVVSLLGLVRARARRGARRKDA